jgi:indole-3-glycerol phosphate synthase
MLRVTERIKVILTLNVMKGKNLGYRELFEIVWSLTFLAMVKWNVIASLSLAISVIIGIIATKYWIYCRIKMLDSIVARKREDVEQRKREFPLPFLNELIAQREAIRDFALAISGKYTRLIAEVKRASPSRGVLCHNFNPVELAKSYAEGGAAAISVLTESNYFQGNLDYLAAIRNNVNLPILRKDFIFDAYQIYESCAFGADALLLIAAILSHEQLESLLHMSHSLGLSCLVEVHSEKELCRVLPSKAGIIGINNRDLNNFTVDIDTTRRLLPFIPPGRIVISESGINNRSEVEKMNSWGVRAVLVGETLVTSGDVVNKARELVL